MIMGKIPEITGFLAKSGGRKDLMCHLYETTIMMEIQCRHGVFRHIVETMAKKLGTTKENIIRMMMFISAVHDIGKIFPAFQKKVGNPAPEFAGASDRLFRHECYGSRLIEEFLLEKGFSHRTVLAVKNTVYMHHQGRKDDAGDPYTCKDRELYTELAKEVLEKVWELFGFVDPEFTYRDVNGLYIVMTGAVIISDWSASSEGVYDDRRYDDYADMGLYFGHLREQAYSFLKENRMLYGNMTKKPVTKDSGKLYSDLFGIKSPRPVQKALADHILKKGMDGNLFVLLEDLCAGGKTEAALLFSYLKSGDADGIYMSMPTTATAEAMHTRYGDFIRKCGYACDVPLYSSRAWLSGESLSSDRRLWTSDARTKLLYPFAIGTIDQVIRYSAMQKFGQIGLAAITGKVLIIDEIHDCDDYMLELVYALLRFCGWAGISVIACSATLSDRTKRKLLNAYGNVEEDTTVILNGKEHDGNGKYRLGDAYPLITFTKITEENGVVIDEVPARAYCRKAYSYRFDYILGNGQADRIAETALKMIEKGGIVTVIMNTVDEADDVYDAVLKKAGNIPVYLYHGKMTDEQSGKVSGEILTSLGKQGKAEGKRPERAVVIATQIMQQSMDADTDFLITELCPGDALIQRFGRRHRHDDKGTIRETLKEDCPVVILCSPEEKNFAVENRVYGREEMDSPDAVERTYDWLKNRSDRTIRTPEDIREFINTVYPDRRKIRSSGSTHAPGLIGNPYSEEHPYRMMAENEALETRVSTRYEKSPSYSILILTPDIMERVSRTEGILPVEEIREIVRKHAVKNVSPKRLEPFSDRLYGGDVKGILSEYEIYRADNDGKVVSDRNVMYIHDKKGLIIR